MNTTTSNTATIVPVVGMGATVQGWSDSKAHTIIAVSKSGKTITIQRDKATLLNGVNSKASDAMTFSPGGFVGHWSGAQRYEYARDENGATCRATLRRDGRWWVANSKQGVTLDVRHEYYDFNF